MEEVTLERCILCTHSTDEYRRFISTDCGALLPSLMSHRHSLLSVGETIPSVGERPELTVVDLTPATQGLLRAETTVIVLPPREESKVHTEKPHTIAAPTDHSVPWDSKNEWDEECDEDMCVVGLDETLPAGSASAPLSFFLRALLPSPSSSSSSSPSSSSSVVVLCGDSEYATAMDISIRETAATDTVLRAGRDAFRNIRAAALLDPQPSFFLCCDSYASRRLRVRLSLFRALDTVPLRRVALAPAWPDAMMSAVFGSRHGALAAHAVRAARDALHGRLVAEGDVLSIPVTLCGFVQSQLDTSDTAEIALQHAAHMASSGSAATAAMSHAITGGVMPLRVVAVDPFPAGRIALSDGTTEIVLRSFDAVDTADATPLCAPMRIPAQFLTTLSLTRTVREAMADGYTPHTATENTEAEEEDTVFVVHALRDNMPCACIAAAVAEFGVCCAIVDLDAREDAEMEHTITAHLQSRGEVALLVRNAQLLPGRPAVLRLFDRVQSGGKDKPRAGTRVVCLLCESLEPVPPAVAARARNACGVVRGANPTDSDRRMLTESVFTAAAEAFGVRRSLLLSLDAMAAWTVGLSVVDVLAYARACVAATAARALPNGVAPVLSDTHCSAVLQKFQKSHGHSLVSTRLQPVRWSDVGGLEEAKRELRETIQLPILHPELFGEGTRRRMGILFYGPPGCGKTLLAKAVATEMHMNFMSVKGPELINPYVGESELNIRLLFQRARDNAPCIVFFDELDALAPQRGEKGDAGGAMDRVVAQLLVELDGVGQTRSDGTRGSQVFVIGATNRPDLLDPSLLRPGRFDRLCYLGIPATREEQIAAVRALTRKFDLDENVDIPALLEPLAFQYTGADLFALCSDAMMFAVAEMLEEAKANMHGGDTTTTTAKETTETSRLVVKMSHFLRARNQLKASVTPEDLRRYESIKTKFAV